MNTFTCGVRVLRAEGESVTFYCQRTEQVFTRVFTGFQMTGVPVRCGQACPKQESDRG